MILALILSVACIVDTRYPLVEGRNEAEKMRLIGYEIDRNIVELAGDGGGSALGEIEGYINGDGTYMISAKVWAGRATRYAIFVNYAQIAAWTIEGKGKWVTVESTPVKLETPSIITIQAIGYEAREAFIDFVTIKKK